MKLRDGQWIIEPALPDAKALRVASVDEVLVQLPKADVAEVLDSFELLESVPAYKCLSLRVLAMALGLALNGACGAAQPVTAQDSYEHV